MTNYRCRFTFSNDVDLWVEMCGEYEEAIEEAARDYAEKIGVTFLYAEIAEDDE